MSQPDFSEYVNNICKGIKSRPMREDIMEELTNHLEDNYERNLAVGMTEEEARQNAIDKMGDSDALSYRLSAVHSYSPLNAMSSAFFSLIGGYLCMNFFLKGSVKDILFILGIPIIFSALLRIRKLNGRTEKAFHFFNFSVIARLALYCMRLGRILPVYFECRFVAVIFVLQGIFWFLLFTGLHNFCQPYLTEDKKKPHLYFCGVYHLMLCFLNGFIVALSEGENVDIPSFILPLFMIFMYFYGTVQLTRMRSILWDADGEYGILPADKKHFTVYTCVLAVCVATVLIFNYASSNQKPVKTELVIHDVSEAEQEEADKVRQKLLEWDVKEQIVEDLPDSEILRYKDAAFVTWGADGGSMVIDNSNTDVVSTVWYYYFFFPDERFEDNYTVRLLCYVENTYADTVKKLYRRGFYYVPWHKGFIGQNLEDELNGAFISIITEENGKKYNSEPFFTYKLKDTKNGYPTEFPKGFEYREEKGQRVYFATQLGLTYSGYNEKIYAATTRQRFFLFFNYKTSAEFVKTVVDYDTITIRNDKFHPYSYRLHEMHIGNLENCDFE